MDTGTRFALVTDYMFTVLCFITALALVKLIHMVHKKLGTKDLVISFMLLSLTLSCLTNMIFFGFSIKHTYNYEVQPEVDPNAPVEPMPPY